MTPALRPADRWDWWELPREWIAAVGAAPGVVYRANGGVEVHRTHLPLLAAAGYPVPPTVDPDPGEGRLGVTYRPWQRRAAAWMANRRGVMLAVSPRLGKTLCALTQHDPNTGPLVILAPLDVRQVWLDAVEAVFPGIDVLALEGHTVDPDAIKSASVIFGHYDILSHQRVASLAPGTLIVDEVHLLSNPKSQRATAVRYFATLAKRVITLSGTPLWNTTAGLWPLLAVTNPGAWGNKPHDFMQRYCTPTLSEHGWRYGEVSNVDEWLLRRHEVVFEATWKTEMPDLPPVQRHRVLAPCDPHVLDRAVAELEAAHATGRGDESMIGAIARYRKQTGMLKVPTAVDRALGQETPVVLWSWHKDVAKKIAVATQAAGRPSFMIHGDLSAQKRLASIAAWRETPDGVLAATLSVGQVGIDLSHAPRAIVVEWDWTPAVMYQGEMRTFPGNNPTRSHDVTQITLDHPVENLVLDHVNRKVDRGAAAMMMAAGDDFSVAENANDGANLLDDFARIFDAFA